MKIIAVIYFALYVLSLILQVFILGKERRPLTPVVWLFNLALTLPILFLLYNVIIS